MGTLTNADLLLPRGWPPATTVYLQRRTDQPPPSPRPRPPSVAIVFASDNDGTKRPTTPRSTCPATRDSLILRRRPRQRRTRSSVLTQLRDASFPVNPSPGYSSGSFYDGQDWGQAIASLLFGDVNPSGYLPARSRPRCPQCPCRAAPWAGHQRPGAVLLWPGTSATGGTTPTQHRPPLFPFGVRPVLQLVVRIHQTFSRALFPPRQPGDGHRDGHHHREPGRHRRRPAVLVALPSAVLSASPAQGIPRITLIPGASSTVTSTSPSPAHDPGSWYTLRATGSPAAPTRSCCALLRKPAV